MKELMEHLSNPMILLDDKGNSVRTNPSMDVLCDELDLSKEDLHLKGFGLDLQEIKSNRLYQRELGGSQIRFRIFPLEEEKNYLLVLDKSVSVTPLLDPVLEVTEDIVLITDSQGKLKRYNPTAQSFYQEVLGRTLVPREKVFFDKETPAESLVQAIARKTPVSKNVTYANGQTITYTCTPTFSQDGEVRFVVILGQDITKILQDEKKLQLTLEEKNRYLSEIQYFSAGKLIIDGEKMKGLVKVAKKVAPSTIPVLLEGETGTGKELFARLIHVESERSEKPFIVVNCAAIPLNLLESELFGYEGRSFTDANKEGKQGLLEMAHGGTIFLDEIGELPLDMQAKLLRVTQNGTFHSIGSPELKKVDVRYISATNADLEQSSSFRKDLYYRLSGVKLNIPPLRERKENILPLIESFLNDYNEKYKKNVFLTEDIEKFLIDYPWPGNVRQLKNILERIVVLSEMSIPSLEEIEFIMGIQEEEEEDALISVKGEMSLKEAYELLDEALVEKAKQQGARSVSEIAKMLEVSPSTLYRKNLQSLFKENDSL